MAANFYDNNYVYLITTKNSFQVLQNLTEDINVNNCPPPWISDIKVKASCSVHHFHSPKICPKPKIFNHIHNQSCAAFSGTHCSGRSPLSLVCKVHMRCTLKNIQFHAGQNDILSQKKSSVYYPQKTRRGARRHRTKNPLAQSSSFLSKTQSTTMSRLRQSFSAKYHFLKQRIISLKLRQSCQLQGLHSSKYVSRPCPSPDVLKKMRLSIFRERWNINKNRECTQDKNTTNSWNFLTQTDIIARVQNEHYLNEIRAVELLPLEKRYEIQTWVNTSFWNFDHAEQRLNFISFGLQDCITLSHFSPSFKFARVLPVNIFGHEAPVIWDTGASHTVATQVWSNLHLPYNYQAYLKPYTGNKLLSCTNQPLQISGVYELRFTIGILEITSDIIIYEAPIAECLLGLNIIDFYHLIDDKYAVYIRRTDFEAFSAPQNINKQRINIDQMGQLKRIRLAEYEEQNIKVFEYDEHQNIAAMVQYELYASHSYLLQPGQSVHLTCHIFPDIKDVPGGVLCAHSEYVQEGEDIFKLNVFYQMIDPPNQQQQCVIFVQNRTQDVWDIQEAELIGHLEYFNFLYCILLFYNE